MIIKKNIFKIRGDRKSNRLFDRDSYVRVDRDPRESFFFNSETCTSVRIPNETDDFQLGLDVLKLADYIYACKTPPGRESRYDQFSRHVVRDEVCTRES